MGTLYHLRRFQDPIQFASSSIYSPDKSESIFLPVVTRRNKDGTSPVTDSEKCNRSGNSRFLLPAISFTQRENGKLRPVKDLSILIYRRKQPFKMETTKSVCKSILVKDWAVNGCVYTFSESSAFKEVPPLRVRQSCLPIHGTIFWNVPKFVHSYQIDGRNRCSTALTCHLNLLYLDNWLIEIFYVIE